MKKNIRLVLLAVLLVVMVAMTVTVASAATHDVSSADELISAVNGAVAGDVINVTGSIDLTETLVIEKDLTLQGTGTVKVKGNANLSKIPALIKVKGSAKLTVLSGTYVSPTTVFQITDTAQAVFGDKDNMGTGYPLVQNTSSAASGTYAAVDVGTTSTVDGAVTFYDGWYSFFGIKSGVSSSGSVGLWVHTATDVNINGGKFSFKYNYDVKSSSIQKNADGCLYGWALYTTGKAAQIDMMGGGMYSSDSSATIYNGVAGTKLNIGGTFEIYGYRILNMASGCSYTLHVTGGTFRQGAGQANSTAFGNANVDGAKIIIDDGNFQFKTGNAAVHFWNLTANMEMTINGGTFYYTCNSSAGGNYMFNLDNANAKLTINGGTFVKSGMGCTMFRKVKGTLTINGGDFTNNGSGNTIDISDPIGKTTVKNAVFGGTTLGYWLNVTAEENDQGTNAQVTIEGVTAETTNYTLFVASSAKVKAKITLKDTTLHSTTFRAVSDANGCVYSVVNCKLISDGPDTSAAIFRIRGNRRMYSWDQVISKAKNGDIIEIIGNAKWSLTWSAPKDVTITCLEYKNDAGETVMSAIGGMEITAGNVTFDNVVMECTFGSGIVMNTEGTSLTIKSGRYYSSSGIAIAITKSGAKVVIEGGTFEQNSTNHLIVVKTGAAAAVKDKSPLKITGGTFKSTTLSHIAQIASSDYIDILGGHFEGGQAWFHISAPATVNLGDPENPEALTGLNATSRAIWLTNASKGGKLNINGGVYQLEKESGASYFINAAGASVTINGGKFIARVSIVSMHDGDYVSHVVINGGDFLTEFTASAVNFNAAESSGSAEAAGSLTVNGGTFTATGTGDIFNITADKKDAFVQINGGTFTSTKSRILRCESCMADVTITGGDFTANGARIFYFGSASNVFRIEGGIFTLQNKTTGAYSDDTLIFCTGNAPSTIIITGGTFINARTKSQQLVLLQNEKCALYFAGGTYLMANGDGMFINDRNDAGKCVDVNKNKKDTVGEVEYYVYAVRPGHADAPLPTFQPTMRVNLEAQGLRFSSVIMSSTITKFRSEGVKNISYGTVIAPAEYLKDLEVADGNYIAALTALAASKGVDASKIFVDVPAVNGIIEDENSGNVTINASLVNIKEENWDRAMVGIGYIKANTSEGTVYYFSAVNVEGAISLSKAAEIAYNDTKDAWQKVGTKVYCYRFVGDNKLFSRYAPSVQESLKKYFAPAAPAPETNPAQ
ncbi:MAG: hypothetical protein E7644_02125 [Ruminococcaceae bacterium]|nr:hypothetical protein [Oscillospiraceae bacterium]